MKTINTLLHLALMAMCFSSTTAFVVRAFAGPNPTSEALRVVGGEMMRDVATSKPVVDSITGAVVPRVDAMLHTALNPYAGVVSQITHNENATEEYIKEVDAKVAQAIEMSLRYPEKRQEIFLNLTREVINPVVDVTEEGVRGVRENVVTTVDTRLRTAVAPFQPVARLMGKDEDIDTWIKAVDESLENVIQIQPLSEEAAAIRNLRDTVLQPYMSRYQSTNNQIDSDIDALDSSSAADATSKNPLSRDATGGNPMLKYYQRFWEVRNNITGPSLSDVLENAANTPEPEVTKWQQNPVAAVEQVGTESTQPLNPQPLNIRPLVNQPSLGQASPSLVLPGQATPAQSALTLKDLDTKAFKAIRNKLASVLDNVPEELVTVNPRFLMKHPNWLGVTVSKMKADNPNITDEELADALSDMLRMLRMKRQARNLASKGCTSKVIEEKLKDFWIEKKFIDFENPKC